MTQCKDCIHKEICQFYNALGCKVLCQECGFFIHQADVVPKSEVEEIIKERELNRVNSLTAKFLLEDREARYKALMAEHDRELAREIIEELKKVMIDEYRYPIIAELKKKYTESEDKV